ncbi:MAG: hypothetical protein IPG92_16470 [Flavobacteriales bacterium]|nr:hypothetical protein [Flavobacteriales bacterium]
MITAAPSLAMALHADARWPVGGDTISGAIDLRVNQLGLKELGWYTHPLNVQGQWQGTGTFSMDGFVALAIKGDSVMLSNNERSFRLEKFIVQGRLAEDSTLFVLDSDALEVEYHTNVPPDSLLPRTREKLLSFFRADTTFMAAPGSQMDLHIALPRTEWLTGIVLPALKTIELNEFTGNYDSDADVFRTTIDLPLLQYQDISITGLRVQADAKGSALDGSLKLDSALQRLPLGRTHAHRCLRTRHFAHRIEDPGRRCTAQVRGAHRLPTHERRDPHAPRRRSRSRYVHLVSGSIELAALHRRRTHGGALRPQQWRATGRTGDEHW